MCGFIDSVSVVKVGEIANIDEPRKQLILHPNPTIGSFTFKGERQPEQVTLLNQQGQEVKVFTATESYDISDLSTGVYFVEYVLDEQVFRSKLVKE